jgi:hypothetical protein
VLIRHREDEVDFVDADTKDLTSVLWRLAVVGLLLAGGLLPRSRGLGRRRLRLSRRRLGGLLRRGSLRRLRRGLLAWGGLSYAQNRRNGRQTEKFCPHISLHFTNGAPLSNTAEITGVLTDSVQDSLTLARKAVSSGGRGASSSKGLPVKGCVNSRRAACRKLRPSLSRSGPFFRRLARDELAWSAA